MRKVTIMKSKLRFRCQVAQEDRLEQNLTRSKCRRKLSGRSSARKSCLRHTETFFKCQKIHWTIAQTPWVLRRRQLSGLYLRLFGKAAKFVGLPLPRLAWGHTWLREQIFHDWGTAHREWDLICRRLSLWMFLELNLSQALAWYSKGWVLNGPSQVQTG